MKHHSTIWIIGASSGIGAALAKRYAKAGKTVAISARSEDKLNELAAAHAGLSAYPLDITDVEAIKEAHAAITQDHGPIDLVVISAGTWTAMGADEFDAEAMVRMVKVNYIGAVNVLEPVMPDMMARKSGHIAFVASVAGYRGIPRSIGYGPTKAAINNLAESLQPDLAQYNVTVSVINPGFVDTPMTEVNDFPMPFLIDADTAAEKMERGLRTGKFEVAFPWQLVTILKTLRILPIRLYLWIMKRTALRASND